MSRLLTRNNGGCACLTELRDRALPVSILAAVFGSVARRRTDPQGRLSKASR